MNTIMLKIAICDDNKSDLKNTYHIVRDYFSRSDIEYSIKLYNNPNDVIEDAIDFQMLFLDIELQNVNGIKIANEINKINYNYKLFLVSNYNEYLKDGYRVKADRYFTKPIDQNEFKMDMDDVLNEFLLQDSYIIDTKVCKEKIMIKDILYVEILARKTYLHTKTGKYATNYTLLYWKEALKEYCFSQPHKSFYVNLQNIKDYDNHKICVYNDIVEEKEFIPISRFYKEKFIQTYITFVNKNI